MFLTSKLSIVDLKYALISLSLYIACDWYLLFMQNLQKQLPKEAPEREVLFYLIDAHIYKRCG